MDQEEYTTLMDVFQGIPDPRKARGKRYPWLYLLAPIGTALASKQQTAHAIAHWVILHGPELLERLRPPRSSIPSQSTIRRALHGIAISVLERRLTGFAQYLAAIGPKQGIVKTEAGQVLQGQALDGRELRGVRAHGAGGDLLSGRPGPGPAGGGANWPLRPGCARLFLRGGCAPMLEVTGGLATCA